MNQSLSMSSEGTIIPLQKNRKEIEEVGDGWYKHALGQIGACNQSGDYYVATPEVLALFKPGSELITKADSGFLFGESGHPTVASMKLELKAKFGSDHIDKLSSEDLAAAILDRWMVVDNTNPAVQIKDITLEAKGPSHYIINGLIKPLSEGFKTRLLDSDCNTALSIRSLTRQGMRNDGTYIREITNVITFDVVDVGGMSNATKYMTGESIKLELDVIDNVLKQCKGSSSESSRAMRRAMLQARQQVLECNIMNKNTMSKHTLFDASF